jgi:alkylated DNA repair dioxygenase AlkB
MDLFPNTMVQVVDDAEGGIRYWPGVVAPRVADDWFRAVREHAEWKHEQRPMYDRVVDVPRLLASYRVGADRPGLPLAALLDAVMSVAPAPYTSIGLNLYRDGNDSVAMHGDKLHIVAAGHPIALVSLGAPRRMMIRARAEGSASVALELEPGSVLAMSHACQQTHDHGIPKTQRPVGERISVVFRVRPPGG